MDEGRKGDATLVIREGNIGPHPGPKPSEGVVSWLRKVVDENPDAQIDWETV